MRINTNVGALTASRNVFLNSMATEKSMGKLSSGLRISRASDDAAGLSIANTLRTQSRSLSQASANAEQGNAMLQIAESAASTVQRIIERQKELVIQRANGTTDTNASTIITAELTALDTEKTRIVGQSNFMGTSVFGALTFQVSDAASTVAATLTFVPGAVTDITTADSALVAVNTILGTVGRASNVLEYTTQNLKAAVVNVRAAESTIRDVDMAEEMATFTKNNILTQAAQAMLSQANQGSQSVLQLLR